MMSIELEKRNDERDRNIRFPPPLISLFVSVFPFSPNGEIILDNIVIYTFILIPSFCVSSAFSFGLWATNRENRNENTRRKGEGSPLKESIQTVPSKGAGRQDDVKEIRRENLIMNGSLVVVVSFIITFLSHIFYDSHIQSSHFRTFFFR